MEGSAEDPLKCRSVPCAHPPVMTTCFPLNELLYIRAGILQLAFRWPGIQPNMFKLVRIKPQHTIDRRHLMTLALFSTARCRPTLLTGMAWPGMISFITRSHSSTSSSSVDQFIDYAMRSCKVRIQWLWDILL